MSDGSHPYVQVGAFSTRLDSVDALARVRAELASWLDAAPSDAVDGEDLLLAAHEVLVAALYRRPGAIDLRAEMLPTGGILAEVVSAGDAALFAGEEGARREAVIRRLVRLEVILEGERLVIRLEKKPRRDP